MSLARAQGGSSHGSCQRCEAKGVTPPAPLPQACAAAASPGQRSGGCISAPQVLWHFADAVLLRAGAELSHGSPRHPALQEPPALSPAVLAATALLSGHGSCCDLHGSSLAIVPHPETAAGSCHSCPASAQNAASCKGGQRVPSCAGHRSRATVLPHPLLNEFLPRSSLGVVGMLLPSEFSVAGV